MTASTTLARVTSDPQAFCLQPTLGEPLRRSLAAIRHTRRWTRIADYDLCWQACPEVGDLLYSLTSGTRIAITLCPFHETALVSQIHSAGKACIPLEEANGTPWEWKYM